MHRIQITIPLLVLALISCATIAGKDRMEKFGRISEAYEFSLLDSDYRTAARFLHDSVKQAPLDEKHYKNIKIVEYKIAHMAVSADQLEITQDLELQYFLLNNNRLRSSRHHQVWRYNEAEQVWLLHTGLPEFQH